jgi:penicillin-binding protein 1A
MPRFRQTIHTIELAARRAWAEAVRVYQRDRRVILGVAAAVFIICIASFWAIVATLPGRDELRSLGEMSQATTLYDVHDKPVFTISKEYRVEVGLRDMSPNLRRAIVAVEDQRFAEHHGIDVTRVIAAAWVNFRSGRRSQGGSTITQQLARGAFLGREKTLLRKVREALLAVRIERMYSKDEILELYLNKVYFGDGLHGAEAASRGYFGKPASQLSLSEAALLAGLVKAPSSDAPTVSPARAKARRAVVLRAMFEEGIITGEAFARASREPIELHDALRREEPIGQYFKEEVRQQLVKQFGWERLSESGLRVYTTIDPEMQRAAEEQVAESHTQIEARRAQRKSVKPGGPPLEAALVALDPRTGEVRALVGGRGFTTSKFNRVIQAQRQPGSAFKPFVYAAALESGYSPASLVTHLNEPIQTLQGAWMPEDEHSSGSAMTIRAALRTSSNRAAVRMLEEVGIAKTVSYAQTLGIGTLPSVPSLALGSGEVTLMSMTQAYSTFANGGVLNRATFVRRVEDNDGKVLFDAKPESRQVVSPATAFMMASMLSDVVNYGTGYRARQEGFTLPAAGKTGTTNDFVDAWFVGFTPNLVAGVWVGFDQPQTIIANGFAADLAVPLWAHFMMAATAGDKPEWYSPPKGVVAADVCRVSGLLPSEFCDRVITEYFAAGTVPTQICRAHGLPFDGSQLAAVLPGGQTEVAPSLATTAPRDEPGPTAVAPAIADSGAIVAPPDQPKKRGFWAKVFGKGKDKDKEKDKEKEKPQEDRSVK